LQSGFEKPRASEIVLAPRQEYWFRVWAARGLLYVWIPTAEPAVLAGLHDPAWRVREMCAKVARRRALGAPSRSLPTCSTTAFCASARRPRRRSLRS
jgi:hypothetical protein